MNVTPKLRRLIAARVHTRESVADQCQRILDTRMVAARTEAEARRKAGAL